MKRHTRTSIYNMGRALRYGLMEVV
eukprot:SAG11_NODE_25392_length_359_cov_0.957692_1_plen_24_part_10